MSAPGAGSALSHVLALVPVLVVTHGWVWQIVTYSVLHGSFIHWFFNMLGLWMFGPQIESIRGPRYFLELFLAGVVGGALFSVGLSYSGVLGNPYAPTIGASAGIYAVLVAFGMFFAETEIMMIPLPVLIKAKYVIAILIVVELAMSLQENDGVAHIAHLGGILFGFLFVKFVPRRGFGFAVSENAFAFRNFYHRLKRRQASKKFQVYMRKHGQNPKDDFDDSEFRPPDDKTDGRGGWVN